MSVTTLLFQGPALEMAYDRSGKYLTLTHFEATSGRKTEVRFDPHATRALFEALTYAAQVLGGPLGIEATGGRTIQ